jgi:hypothetical protein
VRIYCVGAAGRVYRGRAGRRADCAMRCGCLTTDVERVRDAERRQIGTRIWADAEVVQRRRALEGAIVVKER